MQIHTYYYSEEGPWISFTEGHVDLAQFSEKAFKDGEVESIMVDLMLTKDDWELHHGYIRKLDKKEAYEACGDPDSRIWEDCGENSDGAKPITAIYWDYTG